MNKKILMALTLISAISFADCGSCDTSCNSCSTSCNSCNSCNSCDGSASCVGADCLCANTDPCDDCAKSINLWQPHSFGAYSSRDIIQKRTFYNVEAESDDKCYQGFFSVAAEYMQSFGQGCKCDSLGARPFWSGTNTMTYGTNNGESNIDAYQFGMGNVVGQGSITLNTKIQHTGADFMLYFTKHKDERGWFFELKAPLGAMIVKNHVTETVAEPDNIPDYQWLTYPAPEARYQTLSEAWAAGAFSDEGEVASSRHKLLVLTKSRLLGCTQTVVRLADVTMVLGYKAYASEKGFVDIGFKVTAPTGNVPTGQFILEPIFGRAGHWFVGGEVTAHYKIWEDTVCNKGIDFWAQGDVGHLFSGRRPDWRTFDLKANGPGSKYLLLQHYFPANPTSDNPTGRLPSFVTQAANVTTVPVKSKFAVEGTFAAAFDFYRENWNLMVGGEFWGRSRECLSFDCCNVIKERVANLNDYAVLGRQIDSNSINLACPPGDTTAGSTIIYYYYLAEPLARICHSQDRFAPTLTNAADACTGLTVLPAASIPAGLADARLAENRISSNLNNALDVAGASAKRAFTGKVFGQLGYTFKDYCYTPNLSVFGGAEFSGRCTDNAVSLWSVGLQGSISF